MPEVHQAPVAGKDPDPSAVLEALRRFVDAGLELDAIWHPMLDRPTYPRYLPSFDEFVSELQNWQEEVEELEPTPPRPVTPVDLTNATTVRAWLKDLRAVICDATVAGEDATRPPSRRRLGRSLARRNLREACRAIDQLIQAAYRGADTLPQG